MTAPQPPAAPASSAVTRGRWTPAARAEVLRALREGDTIAEACRRAGIDPAAVYLQRRVDPAFDTQVNRILGLREEAEMQAAWRMVRRIREGTPVREAREEVRLSESQLRRLRAMDRDLDRKIRDALTLVWGSLRPCGTTAAYNRHVQAGEEPCEPCKQANRLRKQGAAQRIGIKAVNRARGVLARKYREEYQELYRQERARTDRAPASASSRAAGKLATRHREEYLRLVAELRQQIHDQQRKAASRWRAGDRDEQARAAHNAELREQRRRMVLERFAPVENRLLAALADGVPIAEAAREADLPIQAVFGRAEWDHDWRVRLDHALTEGRDPDLRHGTPHTHRAHRCRCPDCRAAKARYR